MHWKIKLAILMVFAVPAFTGYPVTGFKAQIVQGITWAWTVYFLGVNGAVRLLLGARIYGNIIAVAALITLPVIYTGGSLSFLLWISGFGDPAGQTGYSAHYLGLCVTMLTVVPLALSMVAVIPLHAFEQNLLQNASGVSSVRKMMLMAMRVFNHIVYYVIPNTLEVIREEHRHSPPGRAVPESFGRRFAALIRQMVQLGVEGICASIQYIPLWALEISQLPDQQKIQKKDKKEFK